MKLQNRIGQNYQHNVTEMYTTAKIAKEREHEMGAPTPKKGIKMECESRFL